ncbi:RING-H2 finger protein ATL56 [Gastrolobium bilobum]|uniref:RING-H2 finger protein ATL56 n=1 Tax=Gastrolobium bilobum TaxID=150636 RepID=UPI002AB1AC06|nr:RING-H2 finger protein ATL56 [Gastrolobium bilobum]
MPLHPHHVHGDHSQSQSRPKPNPNLLSLFLKSIIMLLLTSLFFLFLGFAAFVLLHLFLIGGAVHRLRSRPAPTRFSATPSNRFSPRDVSKLPHFRFSMGSEPEPEPDSHCVVCLDGFRYGQWCRNLPGCGHVFHRRCIDTWLVKVAACPTCRTPVRLNGSLLDVPRDGSTQFWTCETNTNALTIL